MKTKEAFICPNCNNKQLEISLQTDSYSCLKCGYTSQHGYIIDNKEQIFQSLPELFKDLCIESEGRLWFPNVLNWENVGILFPDGFNKENWEWTVAPCIPIPENQQKNYPVRDKPGKFHTTKTSFPDAIKFGKNFMLALSMLYELKSKMEN